MAALPPTNYTLSSSDGDGEANDGPNVSNNAPRGAVGVGLGPLSETLGTMTNGTTANRPASTRRISKA